MLTKKDLINEEITLTNNIEEAIYILADGSLWDGGFDYGSRGAEHREVEIFSEYDRYDGEKFWIDVTVNMGLIMLIPESKEILIHPSYKPTKQQITKINQAIKKGFIVEEFK